MTKILSTLLITITLLVLFTGCGSIGLEVTENELSYIKKDVLPLVSSQDFEALAYGEGYMSDPEYWVLFDDRIECIGVSYNEFQRKVHRERIFYFDEVGGVGIDLHWIRVIMNNEKVDQELAVVRVYVPQIGGSIVALEDERSQSKVFEEMIKKRL